MIPCHKLKVTVKCTMKIQHYIFLPTVGVGLRAGPLLNREIYKHHKGVKVTLALTRDFLRDVSG